jgi:hypothetical protein
MNTKHSQHSQKFVATSLLEVAAAAHGQRVPKKKYKQSAAQRRATAKKAATVTPGGNVVVSTAYAVDEIRKGWAKK